MAYHSSYTGPQIDQAVSHAVNMDVNPTAGHTDRVVSSGGVKSALTHDLANIIATGTTNTTGTTIASGEYFYLNGTLVRAKADIAVNATFTSGTNYDAVTAGGLNELKTAINGLGNFQFVVEANGNFVTSFPESFRTIFVGINKPVGIIAGTIWSASSYIAVVSTDYSNKYLCTVFFHDNGSIYTFYISADGATVSGVKSITLNQI